MYRSGDLAGVHLEITSRCNASCPQCPRNLSGGPVNPALPLTELTLGDVEQIFPPELVRRLSFLFMNGNYGDPVVARDTLAVFEHLRRLNPRMRLTMHTNGGARDRDWWRALAGVTDGCTFAIDGLEETSPLYRRGTTYEVVEANARAYVEAGGRATWAFLVFRHNEHEVEAARARARALGFAELIVKRTTRFFHDGKLWPRVGVLDRQGELEYYLEAPSDPAYLNEPQVLLSALLAREGRRFASYLEQTEIDCKVAKDRTVFVSAEGLVFPCCWTAGIYNPAVDRGTNAIWRAIERLPGGLSALDARRHGLEAIVDGPFFQEAFAAGWAARTMREGRIPVCAAVCGGFDMQGAAFQRERLEGAK